VIYERLLCRPCTHAPGFELQVLSTDEAPFKAPEPSPFRSDGGGELAPVAHKYRRIALGGDQTLVVRCEVDAIMHYKGADQLLAVKALNEFDPKCVALKCVAASTSAHRPCCFMSAARVSS